MSQAVVSIELRAEAVAELDRETIEKTRAYARRGILFPHAAERPIMIAIAAALHCHPTNVRIIGCWASGAAKPTGRYWISMVAVGSRRWDLSPEVQGWIDRRNACPRDKMPATGITFKISARAA